MIVTAVSNNEGTIWFIWENLLSSFSRNRTPVPAILKWQEETAILKSIQKAQATAKGQIY